jgi:enamine deaminase RidA (YjgF/YER057c/UK114 family)
MDIEVATFRVYNEIAKVCRTFNLCRAWNYIPGILRCETGETIYSRFNTGRRKAFMDAGIGSNLRPPAATGIDILGNEAVIGFLATRNKVLYLSNPLQVDSFNYPGKYGKNPPMFSRGTLTIIQGVPTVFVSGTASIRGSESIYQGDLYKQLEVTLENIQTILDLAQEEGKCDLQEYNAIIYLKNPGRIQEVKSWLQKKGSVIAGGIFLQANVCRPELEVEICVKSSGKLSSGTLPTGSNYL